MDPSHPSGADGLQYEHDAVLLSEITHILLPYLGPYSIATVKRASRTAPTPHDLVRVVASHIEDLGKRELFLRAVKRVLAHRESPPNIRTSPIDPPAAANDPTVVGITPEHRQRGEAALLPFVGPLAGALVARHANRSDNPRDFYERLAAHLRSPEERDGFFMSLRSAGHLRRPSPRATDAALNRPARQSDGQATETSTVEHAAVEITRPPMP